MTRRRRPRSGIASSGSAWRRGRRRPTPRPARAARPPSTSSRRATTRACAAIEPADDSRQPNARAEDDRPGRGTVEPDDADRDPGRAQPERRAHERGGNGLRARPSSESTSERRRPDGVAVARGVDHPCIRAELGLHRPSAEEQGAPAEVGRRLVPGVGPRDEIRDGRAEDVGRARRLPAGGREVERRGDLAPVETTSPAVAFTAAVVLGLSPATPV